MKSKCRKRIFEIIQIAGGSDLASKIFDVCIISLITISIAVTFLQTFDLSPAFVNTLAALDTVCMIVFTIEYILRLITADFLYPDSEKPLLKYILSFDAVVDILSILPFYLAGLIPPGIVVFRLIRVARILKIFRINKYSDPLNLVIHVVKRKASQILASVFLVTVLMLAASILMYYAEHDAQPETFKNSFSGLWWAVATLSTTGYGDIYPVTVIGRIIGMFITILGLFVVAIPTGILTAGFMESVGNIVPGEDEGQSLENMRFKDISNPRTNIVAPHSYRKNGNTVEQISISRCIGKCMVETVEGEITPEIIGEIESQASGSASNRLLFRGDNSLSPEAAEYLNELGIVLVGFEDSFRGDENIYKELLKNNMVILESLDLSGVEDGEYFISAAPLKLKNEDRSPVRAVLLL